jgi:hypothetical protein
VARHSGSFRLFDSEDITRFGDSLARLATDIAAGHSARKISAGSRTGALSALRAVTWQTLSANTAQRATVANELTAAAAVLRQKLAAEDAALGATVQSSLAAARLDLAAKRETIAANAQVLRGKLAVARRDGSAAVTRFRADVRQEQAAAAKAMGASIGQFVADVRTETAALQQAVQSQFRTARAAWGEATTNATTSAPIPEPVVRTEAAPTVGLAGREQRWVPR